MFMTQVVVGVVESWVQCQPIENYITSERTQTQTRVVGIKVLQISTMIIVLSQHLKQEALW